MRPQLNGGTLGRASMESRLVELLTAGDWRTAETEIADEPAAAATHLLKLLFHEAPFDKDSVRVAFAETWRGGTITSFNMVLGGLIEAAGAHTLDGLVRALSDPRWNVYEQAALALARLGPVAAPAVEPLRRDLSADRRRLRAIDALGHIGPAALAAVPQLLQLLEHVDPFVRSYSVTALGGIALNEPVVRDALRLVSREDADAEVREVVREVLE
jgi:HEAT repeat protein